jgi:tRNA (cmo5U34)-methyltransferase
MPADHPPVQDKIFTEPGAGGRDFKFDKKTAGVFDDMVNRSVPFYGEFQRMAGEIAADFAVAGTNLYDIGCATATTLLAVDPAVPPGVRFVGLDNSAAMLEKARQKTAGLRSGRVCEFIETDLNNGVMVENASVVIMILTLQFVRPLVRDKVAASIVRGLNPGGCLILVEKLTFADTLFNRLFIKYYYDMKKRNGYSEMEIAQKREALENVLIPYRPEENRALLIEQGFRHVEEFFRWYNFCGIVAVK